MLRKQLPVCKSYVKYSDFISFFSKLQFVIKSINRKLQKRDNVFIKTVIRNSIIVSLLYKRGKLYYEATKIKI